MPVTPHYAIPYPDGTTALVPLANKFADIANALDTALWTGLAGAPLVGNADTDRAILYPSPVQGNQILRADKGWTEQYYTLYNSSTNPSGSLAGAGWYPVSGSLPLVRSSKTTSQNTSASASVYTPVTFDTDIVNPLGTMHNTSSNNSRFIAPVAGYYKFHGQCRINTTGSGNVQVAKNGSAIADTLWSNNPGTTVFAATEDTLYLNASDYVELWVASGLVSQPVVQGNASLVYIRP
jgi:hypothetical protein